jgi:hypothetical protein
VRQDLFDLSAFLLASGHRIGEALAVLWCDVDLDLGVLRVTSTLIRVGRRPPEGPGLDTGEDGATITSRDVGHPQKCNDVETPANGVPRHHRELARGLEPLTCCFSLGGVGGLASSGVWPGETSH